MTQVTPSDSLERAGLSQRSYNALRRAGVDTLEAVQALDREQLLAIKNLGVKSVDEICRLQQVLASGTPLDAIGGQRPEEAPQQQVPVFLDATGMLRRDIPLGDLALSYRAHRLLTQAGYRFASQLMSVTAEQLLSLRSMGRGSVEEVLAKLAGLSFEPAPPSDLGPLEPYRACMAFVSELVRHTPAQGKALLQALLPVFEAADGAPAQATLYETPAVRKLLSEAIYAHLEQSAYGVKQEALAGLFEGLHMPPGTLQAVLQEMAESHIIRMGRTIALRRPTLEAFVNAIPNDTHREMLRMRLRGKTLEEIGEAHGLTRERVRQIISKCIRSKSMVLEEDQYQAVFRDYGFTREDFQLAFHTDAGVFNYLMLVCDKAGARPLEQLVEDDRYPVEFRKGAERAAYKNHFTIGGERVPKRRPDLADYVVKTYFRNEAQFEQFVQVYATVLEDLGVQGEAQFAINARSYQNRFAESENVLWKYQSRFRYYDMTGRDFTALLEGLNLEQYADVEYSTLKFFRAHPHLMQEYDLHDEYELHNLLKKLYSKRESGGITFTRMPIIAFGAVDRDNQVLELLIRLAPVSVQDFCDAYEEEYGVLSRTVAANFLTCIDAYRHNELLDISYEALPHSQMARMQALLKADYYDIQAVRQQYGRAFPGEDIKRINAYSLKALGFKVYSAYVIRNTYASATEYFRHLLTSEDIVDARAFPASLTSNVSYSSELYSLRSQYEIIEFEPLRYVNRRRLEKAGVTVAHLRDYCRRAWEHIHAKGFFTIEALRRQGFAHPLDDLGFDDWFYASILSEDKERYRYLRAGGNRVFYPGARAVTLEGFFEQIIGPRGSMDIYDFAEHLREVYHVGLDIYKIADIIKGSAMYYDRIMQRIYIDYDTYFEEV